MSIKKNVIIHVSRLSKVFKKQNEVKNIKEIILGVFRSHKRATTHRTGFTALDDISFDVHEGEFFGIVGRNGSGKSTLLKILAGVYHPSDGVAEVKGSLTPFIELGVGFNPELSGRDNVYLNAALMGFTRKETESMYDDIVEFAELKEFMDEKLRNYSSGMQVRLAFSIAIKAKSDILLIDEVLAVGDTAFQHKCLNYFKRVKREGRTVVFVTHDMSSVERFCDRVLVVDKSKFIGIFSPKEASKRYQEINAESELRAAENSGDKDATGVAPIRLASGYIESMVVAEGDDSVVVCGEELIIKFRLNPKKVSRDIKQGLVSISFYDGSNAFVAALDSDKFRCDYGTKTMTVRLPRSPFISGTYTAYASIYQKYNDDYVVVDAYDIGCRFVAIPPNGGDGSGQLFFHDSKWTETR